MAARAVLRPGLLPLYTSGRWKAAANARKHCVSFIEALTAFGDPVSLTIADPGHGELEQRLLLLGRSVSDRLLAVTHVERGGAARVISAPLGLTPRTEEV